MPCALDKIIMEEVSGYIDVVNIFHDVNSILYTDRKTFKVKVNS